MDSQGSPPSEKTTAGDNVLQLQQLAQQVAQGLASRGLRLVLAESCTGGNVAGTLAAIPGISNWLCGSFVIYRNDSKARWLNIPRHLLDDPHIGPVSQEVTEHLARAALDATPEADISAAVTGHVGPGAPNSLDGQVFLAMCDRSQITVIPKHLQLKSPAPANAHDVTARWARLCECTQWVLGELRQVLEDRA